MIGPYGGPELPLGHMVISALAKHYRLPVMSTGGCSDAHTPDAQAGAECMLSVIATELSGPDMVHDCGYLGSGAVGSLEMLLLSAEVISKSRSFVDGMGLTAGDLALDIIAEIGIDGSYLDHLHTYENFRKALWYPRLFRRHQPGQNPDGDIRVDLAGKLEEILGMPRLDLSPGIKGQMRELVWERLNVKI